MPVTRAQTSRNEGLSMVENGVKRDDRQPEAMNGSAEEPDDHGILSTSIDDEKPVLRKRPASQKSRSKRTKIEPQDLGDEPPLYQIDLSRTPAERYVELATAFKEPMRGLVTLFDQIIMGDFPGLSEHGMGAFLRIVHVTAKLFLRRLPDNEQAQELRGISKATGIDFYLLVCFNTLLDLFMGCSSGGIRTRRYDGDLRMLHFRTLDWGMEGLRELVVRLEFVDKPHGQVIARSVTYAGFVGVLTAVRPGLSVSLNFRPCHNDSDSRLSNMKFYGHLLLVLLGIRPSISSHLRSFFLPSSRQPEVELPTFDELTARLPSTPTTAAYIIASDGTRTSIFEKDRVTARIRSSTSFVVATNHDVSPERSGDGSGHDEPPPSPGKTAQVAGMQELIDESIDRKKCIQHEWQSHIDRSKRRNPGLSNDQLAVTEKKLVKMIQRWPITNECTHFACIMDPTEGEILWCRRWMEPIEDPTDVSI